MGLSSFLSGGVEREAEKVLDPLLKDVLDRLESVVSRLETVVENKVVEAETALGQKPTTVEKTKEEEIPPTVSPVTVSETQSTTSSPALSTVLPSVIFPNDVPTHWNGEATETVTPEWPLGQHPTPVPSSAETP